MTTNNSLPQIIVATSDRGNQMAISCALGDLGCDVVCANDGDQLAKFIADDILNAQKPSLIVIAPTLRGGCAGLRLLDALRELGWDTPIFSLEPTRGSTPPPRWADGVSAIFHTPLDSAELRSLAIAHLGARDQSTALARA